MGDGDRQSADNAPSPSGQVPNEYEAAKEPASQDDLDATTRVIKEVQSTNRLIVIVLFVAAVAIEIAVIASISTAIINDTSSRNELKVQVQLLNEEVKVLNSKVK